MLILSQKEIIWSIFAPHHGHNICDGGFAHGKSALKRQTKEGLPPARLGVDVAAVFEKTKHHSAEVLLEADFREFERVATMGGISQFFHFTFKKGNTVLMHHLATDTTSSVAFEVTNQYTNDANPVRRVKKVAI